MLLDLLQKICRAGENVRGMEEQCDCANIQREGGHPGSWELQKHQDDISYHEDLGKNTRYKTERGDKHRRTVRFRCRAEGQLIPYDICSEAGDFRSFCPLINKTIC